MSFQMGNVVVPLRAGLELEHQYSQIGGRATFRTLNGAAVVHRQWGKLKVQIAGRGWQPAGLQFLDPDVPHVLRCTVPRCITAQGVPAFPDGFDAYRTDAGYEPFYQALLPGGDVVDLGAAWASTPGALAYSLWYYPELTVRIEPPEDSGSIHSATDGWSLTCEEI